MATYSDVIAKRLTEICAERNITLNKLARLSGVRQSTLSAILHGYSSVPNLKTLHRIAVGLELRVCELLDFPEMDNTIFDDE